MQTFTSKFGPRDGVYIDGQKEIIGCITEVTFQSTEDFIYPVYRVEWLHNGVNQSHSIAEWRLSLVG